MNRPTTTTRPFQGPHAKTQKKIMSFTSYTLLEYPGIEQSIYQSIHRFVFGSIFRFEDASNRNLEIKFQA